MFYSKLTLIFHISIINFLLVLTTAADLEELSENNVNLIECDLAGQRSTEEPVCNIGKNMSTTFISSTKYRLPIEIHDGLLIWPNKYQPVGTRWSQLCPSPFLIKSMKTNNIKCSNAATCDQDSFCLIPYELNSNIKLNDKLAAFSDDGPLFTDDLKSFNVTFDLEANHNEIVLIDSTNKLDLLRSKPFRSRNIFSLEALLPVSHQINSLCEQASHMFTIHYDSNKEKLYLRLVSGSNSTLYLKRKQCFIFGLSVQRQGTIKSITSVQVNIVDNRMDKPVFDLPVYNFTISENSPLDSLLGKVHAKYTQHKVKYRIVPFNSINQEDDSLPIKINQINGNLSLKSNLDREKYLEVQEMSDQVGSDGILKLSVESSYASAKYAYAKVNIFIQDVNDNQPIAKLSQLTNFGSNNKRLNYSDTHSNSTANMYLYINKNTPVNQIIAYLAVYDPDSGENGTIKSIDLTLLGCKQPSSEKINERNSKLKQLQRESFALESKPTQVPVRLNKIGEKMYTVQLTTSLNFNQVESYSIEMRIKDNGTRPQLESRTVIHLTIIDQNDYAPEFTHDRLTHLSVLENDISTNQLFKVHAVDLDYGKYGEVHYKLANNPYLDKMKLINKGMSMKEIEYEAKKLLDSTFELNSQTGELILLRPLKRDNDLDGDHLDLLVMAIDNYEEVTGGLSEKMTIDSDYETNLDSESETNTYERRSLNATCLLRIKITDKNDNKPVFEKSKLNLTLKKTLGLKQLISMVVTDLDSYETNSKYYNHSKKTNKTVFYRGDRCRKSLEFSLANEISSFLLLVESIESKKQIDHVKCKLSVWFDPSQMSDDLKHSEHVDLIINVKDNGDKITNENSNNEMSTIEIRINLNLNVEHEIEAQTLNYELDTRISSSLNDLKPGLFKLDSVIQLSNKLELVEVFNFGQLINNSKLNVENPENGVFFIDQQIVLNVFSSDQVRDFNMQLLKRLDQQIIAIINSEQDKLSALSQFEGLLFNNSLLATGSNFTAFLFASQRSSTLVQLVILTSVVVLFLVVLFSCCICLIIKQKCKNNKNKTNDLFDSLKKNVLNVIDDDNGGFKQQQKHSVVIIEDLKAYLSDESNIKVNRYLDGLDTAALQIHSMDQQQQSPASVLSSQSSKNDSIKTITNGQSANKCTLSTTSSSCMSSDEGCYGSSDFSSEINIKLKQKQLQHLQMISKTSLITPIKQQQNYYISNLSRFEKIYNNVDSLLESPVSGSYV